MFKWIWNEDLGCNCAEHNSTIRADKNGNVFGGGGDTQVVQPTPPAAPSVSSSISDYVANYPALFELQKTYGPQEAQMQVDLATKYAGQYGAALKAGQEALYPAETQIAKTLNEQVQQGMSSDLPDWARASYLDTMRGQLGENALAGSGADYMSVNMLQAQKQWQDYYRNLGLSQIGRQPIATASTPQTNNILGNYTVPGVMNYNAQNYGNYSNAWSSSPWYTQGNGGNYSGIGSGAGMLLGGLLAAPTGGMSIPMGAMIGGSLGGGVGGMF